VRYVALLRGINLGPHRKIAMADLRVLLSSLGYADVTTLLQSGNALFTSPRDDVPALEQEIEAAIEREMGHDVPVLIRTPDELGRVVAANPFPHALAGPSRYYVAFLSGEPDPDLIATVDPTLYEEDFAAGERCLYIWYPEGLHVSKLSNTFWERRLRLTATSRNWNTTTKLLELAKR
jgi:uncharacterized protein (DUF1697 family)